MRLPCHRFLSSLEATTLMDDGKEEEEYDFLQFGDGIDACSFMKLQEKSKEFMHCNWGLENF